MFLILLAANEKNDVLSLRVKDFLQGVRDISDELLVGFAVCNRIPAIYPPIAASKAVVPDFKTGINITKALYDSLPMITRQTKILLFSDGNFSETDFLRIINRAYAVAIGNYNYRNLLAFTKSEDRIFMPWDAAFLAGTLI